MRPTQLLSSREAEGQFILRGGCAGPCQNLTGGVLLDNQDYAALCGITIRSYETGSIFCGDAFKITEHPRIAANARSTSAVTRGRTAAFQPPANRSNEASNISQPDAIRVVVSAKVAACNATSDKVARRGKTPKANTTPLGLRSVVTKMRRQLTNSLRFSVLVAFAFQKCAASHSR